MQTDAEFWILFREFDGFGTRSFIHHQAGAGQNAFAMRANNGFIDGARAAESIGIDDEPAASDSSVGQFGVHSLCGGALFQPWRFRQCHSWVKWRPERTD